MGKASRNRKAREREAAAREAVGELLQIRELDLFLGWDRRHTGLRTEILAVLLAAGEGPGGEVYEPWARLLPSAAAEPEAAWRALEASMEANDAENEALAEEIGQIARVLDDGDPRRALELIEAAELDSSTYPPFRGALELIRAAALGELPDGDPAERQEEAIAALNRALEFAPAGEPEARALRRLGILYGERQRGDRRSNLRVAIELQRLGIECLKDGEPAELLAGLQGDLAMALARTEDGERGANLAEAKGLCEAALARVGPEQAPGAWAGVRQAQAAVLAAQAWLAGEATSEAEQVYEAIVAEGARIEDPLVLSSAHFQLGRLRRLRAQPSPEAQVRNFENDSQEEAALAEETLLRRALNDLESAAEVLGDDQGNFARARVLGEQTCVLEMLGEREAALAAGREAIAKLSPTATPRACLQTGTKLGALLAEAGEWEEAAAVYRPALAAAERLFHTRISRVGREEETQGSGLLGRWAAFAFAANGEERQAAIALEGSRTRELRFRLRPGTADAEVIAALPAELAAEYAAASAEFAASSPLGSSIADEDRLQAVLSRIRALPGFDAFGGTIGFAEIEAAAEPGCPLLYVNPTPLGTLLLSVGEGGETASEFLSETSSTEIFMRLLGAGWPEEEEEKKSRASYLNAAGGFGEINTPIAAGLAEVTPWIAERLAAPVGAHLAGLGAMGATLVLCGPLATYPLGAASWEEDGAASCLLDRYELRYAPSATAAVVSLRRAAERAKQRRLLVGLADPSAAEPLPGARAELAEIAGHFDAASELASGPGADSSFLRAQAAKASHLHLACHAGAGALGPELVGVELADGPLAVIELSAVARLGTRLTVVSACQTAVPDIARLPGETQSIATAMLLAGSACVIASLWPVDDVATALLMTKLYEELFGEAEPSPPEALRRAQLWLRALDETAEADFLAAHPALGEEFRLREAQGTTPGRRGAGGSAVERRPYSDPGFWAGFIAVGA